VRLGGNPTVTGTDRYDDTTAAPDVQYFYRVTAVNAIGEGMFCGEFAVGAPAGVPASRCVLPGLPIVTDPAGDETGDPANTQRDIREVTAAELFDPASTVNRVTFRMKVTTLSPAPLPSTRWAVFFTRQDPGATTSTEWFVTMVTDDTASPGQPVYRYGHSTVGAGGTRSLVTDGTLDSGSFTPDGTILLTIGQPTRTNTGASGRTFPPLQPGETFTLVNGITQQSGGALLLTTDSTDNGTYAVAGNASCAPNTAPVAALIASTNAGQAPLNVQFNAAGSTDPDPGDSIVSYTFNFGDGSAPVEQTSPIANYVYRDSGNYAATVQVKDSRNKLSENTAQAVVEVASTLQSVVSRKVHNGTPIDMPLPLGGTPAVESRTGGANGDHTIIFTFANNVTQVGTASATSTSGSPTVTSRNVGPGPNQYTVNVSGVQNTRRITVRLDNVQDTEGANLTDVRAQMNVLFGDTNGDGVVNSGDALQTRNRAGQSADGNNFRSDVNIDGTVNGGDTIIVRNQSGNALQSDDSGESRK
jgi:hypothetical protein